MANAQTVATDEDVAAVITPDAMDVDGDNLTYTISTPAGNGSVVVNGDGTFTYTPNADFNGTDTFSYDVTDGQETASATVTVNVAPVNDAPVANAQTVATDEDVAAVITPDAMDVDGDNLTYTISTPAGNGSVVV
ncbi:tandem-95 repeat protein, partial [Algiphilus sp. NNCM1]|nr:tandem-95 repeat protein [Algiphilus acroporae]